MCTGTTEVEPREMVCFKVDNEEELFLINDYIVTHNTSLFYEILKREGGLDTGLLFAFEKGYNFLDGINVVDIESWSDFIDAIDELEDDNEGFVYVGIDTVDIAGRLCQEYVLRKQSTKDGKRYDAMADIPFGKGMSWLKRSFLVNLLVLTVSLVDGWELPMTKTRQLKKNLVLSMTKL